MGNQHNLTLNVDLNVINHLGVGLYSSTPAALTELVANAWDADATEVRITVDAGNRKIIIEDDGHGMDVDSIKSKFLNVGYSRRRHSSKEKYSDSGNRRVMGRKGIGKLAMFALADHIEITSQIKEGNVVGFKIDVPKLRQSLEQGENIVLDEFDGQLLKNGSGTRIVLDQVLKGLKTTEGYLRVKLARRFSILGSTHGFNVFLNDKEITKADRGIYEHVQFLWAFDQDSYDTVTALAKNIASLPNEDDVLSEKEICIKMLNANVNFEGNAYPIKGYIASVFLPANLGSKEDTANILSIFANGRVFAENVLSEASSAKYYQNYLVGEIHADFLDEDDTDRATASREAIKRDDPKYQALLGFIRTTLVDIGDQWDDWRTLLGLNPDDKNNLAVIEWLSTLKDKRDLALAKKIMTSIQNASVHPDDIKNAEGKKILFRGAIIGFEKLRLRKQLDRLANITDVLSAEFAAIFSSLSEVEESAYAEITAQRLEVIKKFKNIVNDPASLEKVAQKYLFDHLWLLDPSWDRVSGRAEMEKTLTEHIKRACPDSTGARLDITYRSSSGRHIVVELKKPKKTNLKYVDLYEQVRKYRIAVEQYYKDKLPNAPQPPLDIYLLISKTPASFGEEDRKSLAQQNGRIITYQQLITDAINAYQSYLDIKEHTGKLESILAKI